MVRGFLVQWTPTCRPSTMSRTSSARRCLRHAPRTADQHHVTSHRCQAHHLTASFLRHLDVSRDRFSSATSSFETSFSSADRDHMASGSRGVFSVGGSSSHDEFVLHGVIFGGTSSSRDGSSSRIAPPSSGCMSWMVCTRTLS